MSATPVDVRTNASPQPSIAFEKIVVGFDYDESASNVLQLASQLSSAFGSHVMVVHAFLYPPASREMQVIPGDFLERSLALAERRLRSSVAVTSPLIDPRKWEVYVDIDQPVELILKTALEHQADLILVGSHGRAGLSNLLLGSTAERILARASCPVMILGPECRVREHPWSKVLLATDLETTGVHTAECAAVLACRFQAGLVCLHVEAGKPHSGNGTDEWTEAHLRETLSRLVAPAVLHQCPFETVVAYGNAAEEILAAAGLKQANLIVLGGGDHLVMADHLPWRTLTHIIASAKCPVLSFPAARRSRATSF